MLEQLSIPSFFNECITKAYTTTVDNTEYAQMLIDIQKMENLHDLLIANLNYENLSDATLLFILSSLYQFFNQNKIMIPCYSQYFTDFFVNKFPTFEMSPYLINWGSKLFALIFRGNQSNAKFILDHINNQYIVSILSSFYISSTKSMNGLTIYFENILKSFKQQTKQNKDSYVLFAKMLSQFRNSTIKPELIEIIMENGGPKTLLNAVNFLDSEDGAFFLRSLNPIINLPVTLHKTEPNRVSYLIQFIDETLDLLQTQDDYRIISELSFLIIQLCECSSIRSLKDPLFLANLFNIIHAVTMNSLNSDILNQFPYAIENWMHFWSMSFEFVLFREDSEFHQFILDNIITLFDFIMPFLADNSLLIYEKIIVSDKSSNFFEYICKLCYYNYDNISNQIFMSYKTGQIEEIIWHIEFAINLMNSHKFDIEQNKYFGSDFNLLKSMIEISDKIPHNSNFIFELSLSSLLSSFFGLYLKRNDNISQQIENALKEHSHLFILYFLRILNTLTLPNLNVQSVRILIDFFNTKKYRLDIFNADIDTPELFSKFSDLSFPFIYEKDKMIESEKLFSSFFSILFDKVPKVEGGYNHSYSLTFNTSNNELLIQVFDSFLKEMKTAVNVPFILNILSSAFKQNTHDELCLKFYFEALLPFFTSIIKNDNQVLFKHIAKFILNVVTSYEDKQQIFKFMTPKILMFYKLTVDIILKMIQNSEFNEHIHHFCIESICSLIKNKSLNIGIMSFYGENSFSEFIHHFLMVINQQQLTSKFFSDLINLIDILIRHFDMNQSPFFDLFSFFLTEIVLKELSQFQFKDILKTIKVLTMTFDCCSLFDLKMMQNLLSCFLHILPLFKNIPLDVMIFYLRLFYITKDQVILELASQYLHDDDLSFFQAEYNRLLEMDMFYQKTSKIEEEHQEMMKYIKDIMKLS